VNKILRILLQISKYFYFFATIAFLFSAFTWGFRFVDEEYVLKHLESSVGSALLAVKYLFAFIFFKLSIKLLTFYETNKLEELKIFLKKTSKILLVLAALDALTILSQLILKLESFKANEEIAKRGDGALSTAVAFYLENKSFLIDTINYLDIRPSGLTALFLALIFYFISKK